jgi:hypothetical protein
MRFLGITMRTARCGTCNESFFTMTAKPTEIEYCCLAHQGRVILRYDKMGAARSTGHKLIGSVQRNGVDSSR